MARMDSKAEAPRDMDDGDVGDDRRGGKGGRGAPRRKVCRFCAETTTLIDYKNPQLLKGFITDRGKMVPRRISGTCARHQRSLSNALRRSRMLALVPFTVTGE
jgi:small subunit ribosomal protein S18